MVFSSITFLYFFLPFTLLLYYLLPLNGKNILLFVSGLIFYAWGEPVYLFIMVLSTLIDYTAGRLLGRWETFPRRRLVVLLVSVCMNLGLLAIFKYSSFFIQNFNAWTGLGIPDPKLPLPIGISFYTFQSMSYTIDLYLRNVQMQKSFIRFGAYVTMFPQIVAGPIVRYQDVAAELDQRSLTREGLSDGIARFARGLGKKVLLANNIGMLWSTVKALPQEELTAITAWLGILAFTFQIYYDFSGYSDMAVGMGKMLGFHFPENFNLPYTATSITDFWRRWHMTLSGWFKSYVYIPLGGNRCGTGKTVRNLLIVWMLTGFWHGASWNFILWGLYFGVILIIERFFLRKYLERLPIFLQKTYAFLLVVFGWVLFELESLPAIGGYFAAMFGAHGLINAHAGYLLYNYLLLFLLCAFFAGNLPAKLWNWIGSKLRHPEGLAWATPVMVVGLMTAATAFLVNATYNPFLYFRF